MIGFANAKINIGLQVVRKREDGYHDLESVFYPIPLYDVVEIISNPELKRGEVNFLPTGLAVPGQPEDNLCLRAYQLIHQQLSLPGIDLYLHKTIPFGAGLGGGSSDAVQVLKLLNQLFGLGLSTADLLKYARLLGADCPFFVENEASFATGVGDKLEKIGLSLQKFNLLLIKPSFTISTKSAFAGVQLNSQGRNLRAHINSEVSEWKNFIFNDFEPGYIEKFPVIQGLKNELYKHGAVYSAMSGTGSCVYALFESTINQDITCSISRRFEAVEIFVMPL